MWCVLYNILREARIPAPCQKRVDDVLPLPDENLVPLTRHNIRSGNNCTATRELFKNYFNGTGDVAWQNNYAPQH